MSTATLRGCLLGLFGALLAAGAVLLATQAAPPTADAAPQLQCASPVGGEVILYVLDAGLDSTTSACTGTPQTSASASDTCISLENRSSAEPLRFRQATSCEEFNHSQIPPCWVLVDGTTIEDLRGSYSDAGFSPASSVRVTVDSDCDDTNDNADCASSNASLPRSLLDGDCDGLTGDADDCPGYNPADLNSDGVNDTTGGALTGVISNDTDRDGAADCRDHCPALSTTSPFTLVDAEPDGRDDRCQNDFDYADLLSPPNNFRVDTDLMLIECDETTGLADVTIWLTPDPHAPRISFPQNATKVAPGNRPLTYRYETSLTVFGGTTVLTDSGTTRHIDGPLELQLTGIPDGSHPFSIRNTGIEPDRAPGTITRELWDFSRMELDIACNPSIDVSVNADCDSEVSPQGFISIEAFEDYYSGSSSLSGEPGGSTPDGQYVIPYDPLTITELTATVGNESQTEGFSSFVYFDFYGLDDGDYDVEVFNELGGNSYQHFDGSVEVDCEDDDEPLDCTGPNRTRAGTDLSCVPPLVKLTTGACNAPTGSLTVEITVDPTSRYEPDMRITVEQSSSILQSFDVGTGDSTTSIEGLAEGNYFLNIIDIDEFSFLFGEGISVDTCQEPTTGSTGFDGTVTATA